MSETPIDRLLVWEQIDHTLANLMLADVSEVMRSVVQEDERRIRSENRGNENTLAIPSQLFDKHVIRVDEWAQRTYDVYCEVWRRQGKPLSPEFLRAVCNVGIRTVIGARTNAIVADFELHVLRTRRYPTEWVRAVVAEFRREMARLFSRWQRKIEILARTQEHRQKALLEGLQETPQYPQRFPTRAHARVEAEKMQAVEAAGSAQDKKRHRSSLIDAFLDKCNAVPAIMPKILRKHICQAVGHKTTRQFHYWQAGDERGPGKNRGATEEDDRNFRRILAMDSVDFIQLLRRKKLI